jgi:cytoskeleton protein RodZ
MLSYMHVKTFQVASITRIKESCLAAIEDEDYDKLPIEVFARGYIKEYAKYLGVSIEDGLSPYEKYLEIKRNTGEKKAVASAELPVGTLQKSMEKIQTQKADESFCKEVETPPAMSKPEVKTVPEKRIGAKFVWQGGLLLIVVLAIVYQFVSSRNAEQESRVVPMTQQAPSTESRQSPPASTAVTPPAQVSGEEKAPAAIPEKKKHELMISAKDPSWVQVIMDGSEKNETLMRQGDTLSFEAENRFDVILGNAGGVEVKFDGKVLPSGKNGEVVHLSLPEKPKTENPATKNFSSSSKKPADPKNPGPARPKKMPSEKDSPNKLPEPPASTSKP